MAFWSSKTVTVAAAIAVFIAIGNNAHGAESSPLIAPSASSRSLPSCVPTPLTGRHRTYNVGPGQPYTELTGVPWLSLQAGDIVNIFFRSAPYRTFVALKAQGTDTAPIIVNGVTDASCNLPEISGVDAVYATDRTTGYNTQYTTDGSVFFIYRGYADKAKFLTIQNLKITGGSNGINAIAVEDLLVQNCEITDNHGWGVFVNTKNNDPHGEETSYRITIRGNRIYGNGVSGSFLYHNLYVQAYRATYEGNYIGQLRPGAIGSSLKDRSSGTIIRYNMIVAAARALDLVETEGGHGTVDADPLYNDAWVYGNVIIDDDSLPGESSFALIHWGYDNDPAQARKGTLHFYHNTVVANMHGDRGSWLALFDQQSNSNDLSPHNVVEAQNNVIWQTGSASIRMGKSTGTINFIGRNWISSGWGTGNPWIKNSVAVSGASTLIQGSDPMLDADYRPIAGSPVIGQAAGVDPTPVAYEFTRPAGTTARASAADLGARGF
jgi:hypothetical protein